MSYTTGIVIFDGAEELDYVGPWEVFTAAAMKKPGDRVFLIGKDGQPIRSAKGMRVLPDRAYDDTPQLDVVLVPGGKGTRSLIRDAAIHVFLKEQSKRARFVTSVCTGSMILLGSGLATGKRLTTHWSCYDELKAIGPCTVISDARYVKDGNVISAAGVSAGIDMALWIVGQLYDPPFAREVQKYIEYYPAPPYAADGV